MSGMWQGWRGVLDAWEGLRFEAEEYRQLDRERVLVLYRWTGRGKASGVDLGDVQAKGANLLHIRDGKVTRLVGYFERDRALADLGSLQNRISSLPPSSVDQCTRDGIATRLGYRRPCGAATPGRS